MGDFNSTPNPKLDRHPSKKTSLPESQLIKTLKPHFQDIYRLFHPNSAKFTCSHKNSYSRIDQIWTNLSISLIDYTDILDTISTISDHNIVSLEIILSISQNQYK